MRRGALATLEADGHVIRGEAPDPQQRQRYRAAKDDRERQQFRQQARAWALQDIAKPRDRREGAKG